MIVLHVTEDSWQYFGVGMVMTGQETRSYHQCLAECGKERFQLRLGHAPWCC